MNTAANTLLRSLNTLGVQSIRFRVLGLGEHLRHTIPVAQSAEQSASVRLPNVSIAELFAAYVLVPRRGAYLLDVDNGSLAFTPPTARPAVAPARLVAPKKSRAKSKATVRDRRTAYVAAHHKLAA